MSRSQLIQRQVELQHIDPRLAQETPLLAPPRGWPPALCTWSSGRFLALATRGTCKKADVRGDVRIEAAGGHGHQIGGHRGVRGQAVLLAHLCGKSGDLSHQHLAGGTQVGAGRVGGIVAVLAGRRGPPVEVAGAGKALSDQFRTNYLAVLGDQRSVGLVRARKSGRGR